MARNAPINRRKYFYKTPEKTQYAVNFVWATKSRLCLCVNIHDVRQPTLIFDRHRGGKEVNGGGMFYCKQ